MKNWRKRLKAWWKRLDCLSYITIDKFLVLLCNANEDNSVYHRKWTVCSGLDMKLLIICAMLWYDLSLLCGDSTDVCSCYIICVINTDVILQMYRITNVCLGTPPSTFTWEYYDKNKQYHKIGPISPLDFYKEYVKPLFNLEEKVCSFLG